MLFRTFARLMVSAALVAMLMACGGEQRQVIQNKGSDTLVNVAQAWAEAYQMVDPAVVVAVSGGGSGTGIAALINGTVDIANASRAMKEKEVEMAVVAGNQPMEHVVGFDALAVYLHADNPATRISIEQLAEIYGDGGTYTKWTDLGLEVPGCQGQEIVVVSRQNNSGTYAYFRQVVLGKEGDFRLGTRDMHGSKDVVDLVENTPCAIGYSGLAYATDHVKLTCVDTGVGEECVTPTVSTASDGSYPIARPLLMYTDVEPAPHVAAYLNWIKSDQGQCIIKEKGYAPATDVICG